MRRFLITTLAIVLGLSFAAVMFLSGDRAQQEAETTGKHPSSRTTDAPGAQRAAARPTGADDQAPPPQPATQGAAEGPAQASGADRAPGGEQPAPAENETARAGAATQPVNAISGLHVANEAVAGSRTTSPTLGSDVEKSPYNLKLKFDWWGGGVLRATLAEYDRTAHDDEPYTVIHQMRLADGDSSIKPYEARRITVNGAEINLFNKRWRYRAIETSGPMQAGEYHLTLANGNDTPVLRIVRRYVVTPDSYDVELRQRFINLTDQPLNVVFMQYLQGDVPKDRGAYLGDRRMFFTGFINPASRQAGGTIFGGDFYRSRSAVLDSGQVWPNPEIDAANPRLIWLASTNRYFAVATHARVTSRMRRTTDIPPLTTLFPTIGTQVRDAAAEARSDRHIMFAGKTDPMRLAPGAEQSLDLGFYAGPREKGAFHQQPASLLNLDELRLYSMGGMVSCCTFPLLAGGLLWFLKLIEGEILALGGMAIGLYDWGVAIIILVAVVRLALHPLTKKGQVNMMKMSKQMQALQPELEKLKKKYPDDQQKYNQEMMKLYREKGMNPAGMLGCLPMVLQMPIWVALYAMLYFAIELRHEPAFYGVFQRIGHLFGGYWPFLADLSRADRFIPLPGDGVTLSWLPVIDPHFGSINLLPLLMAVVFVLQQHFMSPPATSDQQAQQQKIMKWTLPLFMPFVLYSAPSGLTLYILVSTAAGVFDSYMVRKHVREQEEAGTLFDKKPPKPGGLRDRIQKALEQKQRDLQQARQAGGSGKGNGTSGGGGASGGSPGTKRVKSKSRKR